MTDSQRQWKWAKEISKKSPTNSALFRELLYKFNNCKNYFL